MTTEIRPREESLKKIWKGKNERVTVNLNTTKLNYTLDSDDEVTLWGKVTGSGIPRT